MSTPRNYPHWLQAYTAYTENTEAPMLFHFWSGVSAIAGALRRKVWIDQVFFEWVGNFYIVLVSEPGIVNKSTTIGIAKDLLRNIGGINFGPSAMTWQALVNSMASCCESFEHKGEFHEMSAITCAVSELGTFLDPQNREMVDILVDLWDGKRDTWEKKTKTSGNDSITNPWINVIAGTTPAWLTENFSNLMTGGGFAARCIFVYGADKKSLIAYPSRQSNTFHADTRKKLIADLERISLLAGPMTITNAAYDWGQAWYENLNTTRAGLEHLNDEKFAHYRSRRQTHLHKLAMIISVSKSDSLLIDVDDLAEADAILSATEKESLSAVFNSIGKADSAKLIDRVISILAQHPAVPKAAILRDLLRMADPRTCNDVINAAVHANLCRLEKRNGIVHLISLAEAKNAA